MSSRVEALLERMALALEQIALEGLEQESVTAQASSQLAPVLAFSAPTTGTVNPPRNPLFQPIGWKCPEHGTSRTVPAGINRAGKPYDAFVACGNRDCRRTADRDARRVAAEQASQRALP